MMCCSLPVMGCRRRKARPSFHGGLVMILMVLVVVSLLVMNMLDSVPIGIIVLIIDFLILEKILLVGAFVLLIVLQTENKTEHCTCIVFSRPSQS